MIEYYGKKQEKNEEYEKKKNEKGVWKKSLYKSFWRRKRKEKKCTEETTIGIKLML